MNVMLTQHATRLFVATAIVVGTVTIPRGASAVQGQRSPEDTIQHDLTTLVQYRSRSQIQADLRAAQNRRHEAETRLRQIVRLRSDIEAAKEVKEEQADAFEARKEQAEDQNRGAASREFETKETQLRMERELLERMRDLYNVEHDLESAAMSRSRARMELHGAELSLLEKRISLPPSPGATLDRATTELVGRVLELQGNEAERQQEFVEKRRELIQKRIEVFEAAAALLAFNRT